MKQLVIALLFCTIGWCGQEASAAQLAKLAVDAYSGYLVSTAFESRDVESFLSITDQPYFDHVFRTAIAAREKSHLLPKDAFKSLTILAVVKLGNSAWKYKVDGASVTDGVVKLRYRSTLGRTGSSGSNRPPIGNVAIPRSALIVSIPKSSYKAIQFIENGKIVSGGRYMINFLRWDSIYFDVPRIPRRANSPRSIAKRRPRRQSQDSESTCCRPPMSSSPRAPNRPTVA